MAQKLFRPQRGTRLMGMAAVVGTLALSACSLDSTNNNNAVGDKDASFVNLSPASSDGEKRAVRSSDFATIDGKTGEIGYNVLLRSGEQRGSSADLNIFGQTIDNANKPVLAADGSKTVADSNDFSSILKIGTKLYNVSQFESQPGSMYLNELSQNSKTGQLSVLSTKAIDLSSINGIWNPCAGSVTPWQTHLGSEEYEPNAKVPSTANTMAPFFGGGTTIGGDATKVNPFFWGFPVEVSVTEAGVPTATKHYSMGRFAHELSYVMPDNKTVYETDDGTNVGFYRYVAKTASNLSEGTLYAMKWTQTSTAGASELGTADISWIELGSAKDSDIKTLIDGGATFTTIFDAVAPVAGACASGYNSINTNGYGQECLKLKTGQEKAAAFLETRRYAAMLGATTEMRKEEGVTFDPDGKKLYVAYSEVNSGMEDSKSKGVANSNNDGGGPNHVKLRYNQCGAVYSYDVDSSFTATKANGVLTGRMTTKADPSKFNPTTIDAYPAGDALEANACDVNAIANPDNISFMPGQKTLLIGEDSGNEHQNDAIWSFNIETKALTRIATTPYGAETTSLYYYPNVNNFGYIMAVVQHPYGESDTTKVAPGSAERRSYLGYIGALPPHQ